MFSLENVALWLDVIFPRLCLACKEQCAPHGLCSSCWMECSFPDPVARCPHCFEESEGFCRKCKSSPLLPFVHAFVFEKSPATMCLCRAYPDLLASFAIVQWIELDWPLVDVVVAMRGAKHIAAPFAAMIDRPCLSLFSWGRCNTEAIEEGKTLLLIGAECSREEAKECMSLVQDAFPKKGFLLTIFPLR